MKLTSHLQPGGDLSENAAARLTAVDTDAARGLEVPPLYILAKIGFGSAENWAFEGLQRAAPREDPDDETEEPTDNVSRMRHQRDACLSPVHRACLAAPPAPPPRCGLPDRTFDPRVAV